ncbi:uncharacterized protein LOC127245246 [Andrographis paniculata]|uniref:uncharacterized protein LOC127245246 n=1 Tax=Andrographis paniculata TaxID=175694 RepID=UPI0021E730AA|nr:uncharacterized protein LOC127245246 [Andrographis paniculata]
MAKTPLLLLLLLSGFLCSVAVSAPASPARIVKGFFSNHAFPVLTKWVMSLKATTKTAMSGRPLMKFEGGYNVETVFDGSKLGIEPHTVEILPDGDLLILDSINSNVYKISSSLSLYSRPRLIMGSADGYAGHVDGRLRDARMNHPRGLTVDDRGNVYIADTDNMAIRKISDTGVTTIAGGKRGRGGGGHVDGPSEDAKFSNDFDVVYLGSSCSLLVIDRGNKAIREIPLHFDDCAYQYGSGFPYGVAMLLSAGFFGYMLALLQRRLRSIMSPQDDEEVMKDSFSSSSYEKPLKSSLRPPLIPNEDEQEKQEESFLGSLGRLVAQTGESAAEILRGLLPVFKTKPTRPINRQQHKYATGSWPVQESFVIPDDDEPPPSIEQRAPTPKKTYAFMSKDSEKMQQLKQSRAFYSGLDVEFQKKQAKKSHQYRPDARSFERPDEMGFGGPQEQEKQRVMKPTTTTDSITGKYPGGDHQNIRPRFGYIHGH